MNGPNMRGEMLRGGGIAHTAGMLPMGSSPFMQNPLPPGQPQMGPNGMVMPPNANNPNPPMGMLPSGPNPMVTTTPVQRYISQPNQQRHNLIMRQPQNPGMAPSAPMSAPPIQGLNANQLGGMNFPGAMMPSQSGSNVSVRRVASQPQMNPTNHLGGMPQPLTNNMPMGMNAQSSMPAQLRQAQQQQMRMQQQQQQQMGMPPDMAMAMNPNRQPGNPGMPQRPGPGQGQVMNSLAQPSSTGGVPTPPGMQSSPHHQNNFGNAMPPLSSSPRPQSHTPNMNMSTPGPSHTPINRARMTPDNNNPMSFLGFPGNQYPPQGNNSARMQSASGPYPLAPSSTSPVPMSDITQTMPGLMNVHGSTPTRAGFQLTPAQQFEQMQGHPDAFNNHFNMGPPSGPPRPPSQHNPHPHVPPQQHPSPQQSSHHPSPMEAMNPQRPRSQQSAPGRPPSAQAPSVRTPRSNHQPLPPTAGGLTAMGRIPVQTGMGYVPVQTGPPQPPQQVPIQPSAQHLPIAPRPPAAPPVTVPSNAVAGPSSQQQQPPIDAPPSHTTNIPRGPQPAPPPALGNGQGLIRLLQFSGNLAGESKAKLQLSWWNELVRNYFTPKAVMKFTLWRDNQRNEAKPFEIGVPILPRFFLVTTQSGVKSMTLSLDGARERMYAQGHSIVECVTAVWTYKYNNGYTVVLRGPLTAHVIITSPNPPGTTGTPAYSLKFDDFQFDANFHDKYIALDSIMGARVVESPRTRNAPTPPGSTSAEQQQREEDKQWEEPRVIIERGSIPGEPVNAFGIPQATMRCLELAESVAAMADLISFAAEADLGPKDALARFAAKIRDSGSLNGAGPPLLNGMNNSIPSHPFPSFPGANGVPGISATTLYSSAPPSVTNPPPSNPQTSVNSPQNAPPSATSSPQKQHKTIPQAQSASSSVTASSPAVSTSTANTPAMANATLKRKQASDAASPTIGASEQPPTKRPPRKRGRTQGGG